jgi:hypothetical protein
MECLTNCNNIYIKKITTEMEIDLASCPPNKWLVLIHQIPPKPDALRGKIWRRLQQIGAVAIKPSVYVMPFSDQSREDLSWTLKEIVDGGGDGSISEVRFVEGLTDEQVVSLFEHARKSDYEKIIQEANQLLADWSSANIDPQDPAVKANSQVAKLQRQFDGLVVIDFFKSPERGTAEILIQELIAQSTGAATNASSGQNRIGGLKGKTWVTRRNLFVDRIACGWLIRRFIDDTAVFKYVDPDTDSPAKGEIRFDMFDGEYTHEGDQCTFEVMIKRLGLQEPGLTALAEIIHDIDLVDSKYNRKEADGLSAMLTGLTASESDDEKRMTRGTPLIENLFAYFQRQKGY